MPIARTARRPRRLARVPRRLFPTAAERRYRAFLLDRLRELHQLTLRRLLPALEQASAQLGIRRVDDDETAIEQLWTAIRALKIEWQQVAAAASEQLDLFAGSVGREISAVGKGSLLRQIKAVLGIDPLFRDQGAAAQLALFRRANVELIQSIDARYFSEIESVVANGLRSGQRPEIMARGIDQRYQVGRARATLIARDQTGKLAGQLDEIRQTDLGIKHYIWRTADDERVRASHAARDGQTFAWDDPPGDLSDPGDGGHPGEPIQCRCYAEPMISELLDELEAGGTLAAEEGSEAA